MAELVTLWATFESTEGLCPNSARSSQGVGVVQAITHRPAPARVAVVGGADHHHRISHRGVAGSDHV